LFYPEQRTGIKYWSALRCDMAESSETDKSNIDGAVCAKCGKSAGATVSGSGEAWSFKPKCKCAVDATVESAEAAQKPSGKGKKGKRSAEKSGGIKQTGARIQSDVEPANNDLKPFDDAELPKNLKPADSKPVSGELRPPDGSKPTSFVPKPVGDIRPTSFSVPNKPVMKLPEVSGVWTTEPKDSDSGGWASVNSAKTANGPDTNKSPQSRSLTDSSSGWQNTTSPKSFSGNLSTGSSDISDSWISIGSIDDDFAGSVPDDFNRPVAHEIGSATPVRGTSGGAILSGTSFSGSGSSGNCPNGLGSSKRTVQEEPADWVPVKQTAAEKAKSQFADDSELYELTNKSENHEERVRLTTRKSIQEAFRRNRIKTIIVALIAIVMAYGAYSYASSKGLIKKIGIFGTNLNSNQQTKKGSGRHSKKNKRTR
jgi:hypothetical protein